MMFAQKECRPLFNLIRHLNTSLTNTIKFRDKCYYKYLYASFCINSVNKGYDKDEIGNQNNVNILNNKLLSNVCDIQKRHSSIATKLVQNAPSKVQPYMKLMRIDKPIGLYKHNTHFLLFVSFIFV